MKKKKAIITIVDGLHLRYLLDAGVLEKLALRGVEMLVLTIPALKSRLEKLTASYTHLITTGLLEEVPMTRARRLYLTLINGTNKRLSETVNFKNELTRKDEPVKHFLLKTLRSVSWSWPYHWMTWASARSYSSPYYRAMLDEFQPDLVVFSTPGQKLHDLPLLFECIRARIKTISPVYSWDNLTAKGPFIFRVNRLVVWNEIMRNEAVTYHGYAASDVDISGVPVFDPYVNVLGEGDQREKFFHSFRLDAAKPLITVTTVPTIFFGLGHRELVRRLLRFMGEGKLPACNILLRPHPKDTTDYSEFLSASSVIVDTYGSSPDDSLQKWVPQEDNIIHLGRTMKYSDVVINVASTITIDAACFNTPVINIAYDMKASENEYAGSVKRFYAYTHYMHVVQSNAASIVHSDDELVGAIAAYLHDRTLHSAERKNLVAQQTGILDGKAHERVALSILKMLDQ